MPGLAGSFFDWCAAHGLELTSVRPFHVAAWIDDFPGSKPTVKQKLAAVRMLYDFLVVRQITPSNPAHAVRGPKYGSFGEKGNKVRLCLNVRAG
jgi:site-specific recombinase XerD